MTAEKTSVHLGGYAICRQSTTTCSIICCLSLPLRVLLLKSQSVSSGSDAVCFSGTFHLASCPLFSRCWGKLATEPEILFFFLLLWSFLMGFAHPLLFYLPGTSPQHLAVPLFPPPPTGPPAPCSPPQLTSVCLVESCQQVVLEREWTHEEEKGASV